MRESPFKTEAELCAAYIAFAKTIGLTAYAETEGWDILMVAADGTQIGVQAKLKFNMKLLSQAIEERWWCGVREGPDFRAVLLPHRDGEGILSALGLGLISPDYGWMKGDCFHPDFTGERHWGADWHFWNPECRHKLPVYVPDVVAGASGPVQLTRWKVSALQITAVLELRGYVTRSDFKQFRIDHRRWIGPGGWLDPGKEPGTFVRGAALNFDKQHPVNYAEVRADIKAEIDKGLALGQPRQMVMA